METQDTANMRNTTSHNWSYALSLNSKTHQQFKFYCWVCVWGFPVFLVLLRLTLVYALCFYDYLTNIINYDIIALLTNYITS